MHNLLTLYDTQLRINIEYPGLRKEAFSNLVRFVRPAPGMNFISYSRLNEADIDEVIKQQIAYFSPMPQPFSWHVCDHDAPPSLKHRLLAHGFEPDDEPDAVMALDVQTAWPPLLAPITADVRRLERRDQLDDVTYVEQQVLGRNFDWLKGRLGDHLAIPDYLSVYVAYVEGQPACVGWIYFYPNSQFAGLFGGATRTEYRKRGLYTTLLAVRVQAAIGRGYSYVTTGASPMSRPILAQNGFQLLTYARDYEWKSEWKDKGQNST